MTVLQRIREIYDRLERTSPGKWSFDPRDCYFFDYDKDKNTSTLKPLSNDFVFAYDGNWLGARINGPPEPGRSDFMVRDAWFLSNAKADIKYLLDLIEKGIQLDSKDEL